MEKLSLKSLTKTLTATQIKSAQKVIIRDVDEEKPDFFVAYADINNDSFDVSIKLSKDEIVESNCECENGKSFCVHKVAFALNLSNINVKTKVVKAKKLSDIEILINSVEPKAMHLWLAELFKKNKDLELKFINEFTEQKSDFTKEQVKILMETAIKSVIKNKKNIDATELKKALELIESSLKPVLNYTTTNISNQTGLEILIQIFDCLMDFYEKIYIKTVKIDRLIEKIGKQHIAVIYEIKDNEIWQKTIKNHIDLILDKKSDLRTPTLNYLIEIYESIDKKTDRSLYFANRLRALTISLVSKGIKWNYTVNEFIFHAIVENNLFEKSFLIFEPYTYYNEYNELLISKLIEINQLEKAEKFAKDQIAKNYQAEYNLGYWKLLKEIYAKQNNHQKVVQLAMQTINYDFDILDYDLIKKSLTPEEFKPFRTKLLNKAKNNFYYSKKAIVLYFHIYAEDQNYKKIIENIDRYSGYEMIYPYINQLFITEKTSFLRSLIRIENGYSDREINIEFRAKVVDFVIEKYDEFTIKTIIKSESGYLVNRFSDALLLKLKDK